MRLRIQAFGSGRLVQVCLMQMAIAHGAWLVAAQTPSVTPDLVGGLYAPNCGAATAAPIFDANKMSTGLYGETNLQVVSDPDIVLIGNQWWMIFATGPGYVRAIEPFAAYLPPGASLATSTTYPTDPNGWRLIGANASGTGISVPVTPFPSPQGWDVVAAETPSVDVGADGSVSVYYSGHNSGQTAFQIGLATNFSNGSATGDPNPVMSALEPWEFSSGLGAILEQSVRWMPQLNKYIMYYTAGAWWANPPDNTLAYAESSRWVNWTNRQKMDFPVSYYNQDFMYNANRNRYEMVISNDPTGQGGANSRNLVWREAATPSVNESDWVNEVTLLKYDGPTSQPWYNSGLLSPAVKHGNLPGEQDRIYVFFHSYTQQGDMYIGRFYCDPATVPSLSFAAIPQHTYGDAGFTVSASSASSGAVSYSVLSGLATVNSGTGLVTLTGAGMVNLGASQAAAGSYLAATASEQVTILKQSSSVSLSASANSLTPSQTVTLTAIVSQAVAGSATPTQTITFYDGSTSPATQLGSVATLTNGSASVSNVSLSSGQHSVYAVYSGDGNYQPSTSQGGAVSISVSGLDFSISTSGAATQTVAAGSTASYALALTPTYGTYPGSVSFTVSGLPTNAADSFSPNALPANAGAQTVTMTITTAATRAEVRRSNSAPWSLAVVLPWLIFQCRRNRRARWLGVFCLFAVAFAALTGCGSASHANTPSYTLNVTAVSGTVTHSTTVVLQVE